MEMNETGQNEKAVEQALDRIEEQLNALQKMESSWPVKVDEGNLKAVQTLVNQKQKLINNIQALLENQPDLQNQNKKASSPEAIKSVSQNKLEAIRLLVKDILGMHNEHTYQLKIKTESLQHSMEDVQKALNLIRTYNGEGEKGSRIDVSG